MAWNYNGQTYYYQQQQILFMDQDLNDYDDMFAHMPPEVLNNLSIRIYVMEQYFEMDVNEEEIIQYESKKTNSKKSNTKATQDSGGKGSQGGGPEAVAVAVAAEALAPEENPNKKRSVTMVYNRIISESVYSIYFMNKLIYRKGKMVAALLSNGREIAKKKDQFWYDFLEMEAFSKIKAALYVVEEAGMEDKECRARAEAQRSVIKYSVMSISNLILKLGINMSKVSILPIQRFCSFECLNISILSIVFLQNLQYRLFKTKNIEDPQQQSLFLKQLPKISVIKLCKYRNNTDVETLERGENQFFTKHSTSEKSLIRNLQFIQIHEKSCDPIYPKFKREHQNENIKQFDLEQMSKSSDGKSIQSPFNFEVLLLMKNLVFPMVKDFRPDLIVYIESYPNEEKAMDEEVRGLMLCEMAEETKCNKIYMFKEFGIDKLSLPEQNEIPLLRDIYKKSEQGESICLQTYKVMQKWEEKFFKRYHNLQFMEDSTKREIQRMKKVLINDLTYASLALIQKTSFEMVEDRSHQYFYTPEYLKGIMAEQEKILSNEKQEYYNLNKMIKNKREGIRSMLGVLQMQSKTGSTAILINLPTQTCFTTFYDLLFREEQSLSTPEGEFSFTEEDNFYVKYYPEESKVLVIIIRYKQKMEMIFLSKNEKGSKMRKEKILEFDLKPHYMEGATFQCSHCFLYRGFGKFKFPADKDKLYNTNLHRIRIYPQIGQQWEFVTNKTTAIKSDGKKEANIPFEKKKYGYGIFDQKSNNMLLMGGYIDSWNEDKVSKTIYVIKKSDDPLKENEKDKVESLGKTNKLLFEPKFSDKMFLYPFVFGIPFVKDEIFIINSNGYYLNLTNNGKIFFTALKLSAVSIMYTGILKQGSLIIPDDPEDPESAEKASKVIVFAELMIKLMIHYCSYNNVLGGQCCIKTLEEGLIFIEPICKPDKSKDGEKMKDEKDEKKENEKKEKEKEKKEKKSKGITVEAFEVLESDEKVVLEFMI